MTSKEAIKKIMTILNFTSQKFYEGKSDQGLTMKMESEDMEVGKVLYVATDEGMIPAPAGVYMMEDGAEVTVDEMGMVSKIKMGKSEETDDAKIEEKKEETVIKDDSMAESKEIPPHAEKGDIELVDGTVLRMSMDSLEEGVRVKKVGYDGTLTAIHDGDYETKGGEVITITGGQVVGIMSVAEKKMEGGKFKKEFVEAKTYDGATVESPTFDVGETIDLIKEDGSKEKAPNGEHQIMLKDSSGEEVKIRVMVKDGKIVERENVEEPSESEDEMKAFTEAFAQAMKRLDTKLDSIEKKYEALETKFKKFSSEPAGTKIPKQLNQDTFMKSTNTKVEGFRRLREALSHQN